MSKRQSIILRVMVRIWEQVYKAAHQERREDCHKIASLYGRLTVMHKMHFDNNLLDLVGGSK